MKKILSQLRQQAKYKPDAIAIRSETRAINFKDLVRDIEQVAMQFEAHSVKRLGLYLDNGIDWIVIDLACAMAEVTVVPLPWFFSEGQIKHVLESARIDSIVCEEKSEKFSALFANKTRLYANSALLKIEQRRNEFENEKIAKISFTSGTTGTPKGIELGADLIGDVCHSINALIGDLNIEKHLSLLPYSTLLENICGIYAPLSQGKCVLAEPADRLGLSLDLNINAESLASVINETNPDSLIVTPQLLKLLCVLAENSKLNTQSLKFVAVGGGHVGSQLIERAHRLGIPVYEGYGLTEFASVAMLNTPENFRPGSVGKPLPHVAVSFAADGEILLSTKTNFAEQVYTGDLGTIDDDGFVHINGRKKNILVLSTGRNVSPEWIEGELQSLNCVSQCLVFGDGETELSAFIFSDPGISSEFVNIAIAELNRQLPAYAHIGKWYRMTQPFSLANGLLTSNGRPRREQILNQSKALIEAADLVYQPDQYTPAESKLLPENALC